MNKISHLRENQSNNKSIFGIKKSYGVKNFSSKKIKQTINYKNNFILRKYITMEGKILPQRLTHFNSKKQRHLAKAIKNARIMGFLPFVRQVIY